MDNDIKNHIFAVSKVAKMKRYKVKEVLRLLERDGWYIIAQGGSHRQFKHPAKTGRVTVAGKPNLVLEQEILNSIWKQAGWK